MKEFVEKLIGRLDERLKHTRHRYVRQIGDMTRNWERIKAYQEIIEIVNQLAVEYEQEPVAIHEIIKSNRLDCEVPSDCFEQIKEVRVIDEWTEETKVFKEVRDGWIPCSERLPNEQEMTEMYCRNKYGSEFTVMIEGADKPTTLYRTMDGFWVDDNRESYNVTAWRLLPESYQLKGE